METAKKATATLHKKIKPELNSLGHQEETTPASETGLGEDLKQWTGATLQDAAGGVTTHARETSSRNPLRILKERGAQLFRGRGDALKKAA